MSQMIRKVLAPQYMRNFNCLGTECEDTCCKFWRIDIDHNTYKKYIKITNPKLKYLVDTYVIKNRDASNKNRYARFKLREDKYCAFLDEDGLCMFQKIHGYEYLSDVCKTYPRRHVQLDDTLERSGTVSCPEIARLVLFDEKPIEFDEYTEDASIGAAKERIATTQGSDTEANPLLKLLWPIRILSISILQYRELTIKERLTFLGLFLNKVESLRAEAAWDKISDTIDLYKRVLESGSVKSMLNDIPAEGYAQFKMLIDMIIYRLRASESSSSFKKIIKDMLDGIGYYDGIETEKLFINYNNIKVSYQNSFDSRYPNVFENYLVNYAFSSLFPLYPSVSPVENYIRIVVCYALLKLIITGIGAYYKNYDKEIIQKVFSAFSLTVEHNPLYVDSVVNAILKMEGKMIAYMAILIKD